MEWLPMYQTEEWSLLVKAITRRNFVNIWRRYFYDIIIFTGVTKATRPAYFESVYLCFGDVIMNVGQIILI